MQQGASARLEKLLYKKGGLKKRRRLKVSPTDSIPVKEPIENFVAIAFTWR
jgi:hypothetical protein